MEKFWMLVVEGKGTLDKRYADLESARAEAERLVSIEGRTTIVLEAIGEVAWSKITHP